MFQVSKAFAIDSIFFGEYRYYERVTSMCDAQ